MILLIVSLGSCRPSYDLVLLADPIFFNEVISETAENQIQKELAGKQAFSMVLFDPDVPSDLQNQKAALTSTGELLLSPALSKLYEAGQSSDLDAAVASYTGEGTGPVLMVSENRAEKLSENYNRFVLVYDPAAGWVKADDLLSREFDSPHRIGILYDPAIYGGTYVLEDMFPLLFSHASVQPEVVIIEGGGASRARLEEALHTFSTKGVKVVCFVLGSGTADVLSLLQNYGMLAVVEQGSVLEHYREFCYAYIEVDYPSTILQLYRLSAREKADVSTSELHIPMQWRIVQSIGSR